VNINNVIVNCIFLVLHCNRKLKKFRTITKYLKRTKWFLFVNMVIEVVAFIKLDWFIVECLPFIEI